MSPTDSFGRTQTLFPLKVQAFSIKVKKKFWAAEEIIPTWYLSYYEGKYRVWGARDTQCEDLTLSRKTGKFCRRKCLNWNLKVEKSWAGKRARIWKANQPQKHKSSECEHLWTGEKTHFLPSSFFLFFVKVKFFPSDFWKNVQTN